MSMKKSQLRLNVLTGLLIIGLLTSSVVVVLVRMLTPTDGAILDPRSQPFTPQGVIITPLDKVNGPLRPGDIVLAVNGTSLESMAQVLGSVEAASHWELNQVVSYRLIRDHQQIDVSVPLHRFNIMPLISEYSVGLLSGLVLLAISAFIWWRRPEGLASKVLLVFASGYVAAETWVFGLQISDFVTRDGFWMYKLIHEIGFHIMAIAWFYFVLVFPQVHPVLQKHPWRVFLLICSPTLLYLAYGVLARFTSTSTLDWLGRWFAGDAPLAAVRFMLIAGAAIVNYRIAGTNSVTRQQVRWVIVAFVIGALAVGLFWMLPLWLLGRPLIPSNLVSLSALLLPIALAIAILKYQLFDIDLILSRALTYGFLTVLIVVVYVGTVVGTAWVLNTKPENIFASLIATGIVAVLFQPLRDWLQQWANRFVYGDRDRPYQILAGLAGRLEKIETSGDILPAIVETVAHTLKLPSVALAIRDEDRYRIAAEYPPTLTMGTSGSDPQGQSQLALPIVYQSELIGQLLLLPHAEGEPFTQTDLRLLRDIARLAGPAVYSVRLTADLLRSRERVITAREEERRRIRRDLHDGLGPQLASQMLTLDAVLKLQDRDSKKAGQLLHNLKDQARDALASIRELLYDLRPPALDELGLAGALRERAIQARQTGIEIALDVPDNLPLLPAAVEVAAYRISQEALTNVMKHARATQCRVLLCPTQRGQRPGLLLEVKDNGSGFSEEHKNGIGMQSMRERADELGGSCVIDSAPGNGACVRVWLPLPEIES